MKNKAKFIVGAIGAVAVAASQYFGPDTEIGRALPVIIAVCTAVGVYLVPNAPAPVKPVSDDPVRRSF